MGNIDILRNFDSLSSAVNNSLKKRKKILFNFNIINNFVALKNKIYELSVRFEIFE